MYISSAIIVSGCWQKLYTHKAILKYFFIDIMAVVFFGRLGKLWYVALDKAVWYITCIHHYYWYHKKTHRNYTDVIMGAMAFQITSLPSVYSTVFFADERKHQSSVSLALVQGFHRGPVNSPHKWPVTRKCFHLMTSPLDMKLWKL